MYELVEGSVQPQHQQVLPEFLNVDLEIESNVPLDLVTDEFENNVYVLFNGPYRENVHLLAVEICAGQNDDPDTIIEAFCGLIEKLPSKAKALWRTCASRRFDIGIASGEATKQEGNLLALQLQPETLKRVAALSVQIVITVYSKEKSSRKKKK